MDVEFDPRKNATNIAKHGLSLAEFIGFDGETITMRDDRHDYGEERFRTIGRIGGRLHVIVFVKRGDRLRLIGFRRAHEKEGRQNERRLG